MPYKGKKGHWVQTCFSDRTFAVIVSSSIVAGASVIAGTMDAVIDVRLALGTCPSIHAYAEEAAVLVVTCAAVQTYITASVTFVHICLAVCT